LAWGQLVDVCALEGDEHIQVQPNVLGEPPCRLDVADNVWRDSSTHLPASDPTLTGPGGLLILAGGGHGKPPFANMVSIYGADEGMVARMVQLFECTHLPRR
jgi:hypothetical protein